MSSPADKGESAFDAAFLKWSLVKPRDRRKDLTEQEAVWATLQPWLEEMGYKLRPRYQPGWKASWLAEGFSDDDDVKVYECEDYQRYKRSSVMDAIRVRDGAPVMFKRVARDSDEAQLAAFLSEEALASDPMNHCVQIYEKLEVPGSANDILLVMPLLYIFRLQPAFETVGEVVDFFKQTIEAMHFLHRHNIAHRDCKHDNILAGSAALYSELPHPILPETSYHGRKDLRQCHSRTTRPTKYYYIDFGLSKRYLSRAGNVEPSPWGAAIYDVPEFEVPIGTPTDPFPVDIYMLGMMFRQQFLEETIYSNQKVNLEWMNALAWDMTADDPKARPTIEEVMERFTVLTKALSPWKLRAPVNYTYLPLSRRRKMEHWAVQISRMLRRIPAIPSARRQGASISK